MLTLQNLTKHYKGTDLKADPLGCKSKIAYIPDNPDIYEYLTGIQFLHFIADVFQVSAVDRDEHIRKYADAFEKYHAGNQWRGGAIFFSTHVPDVAEKLCNKVAIIKEGQLVTSGNMESDVTERQSLEAVFMLLLICVLVAAATALLYRHNQRVALP